MKDEKVTKHPSYGVISASRVNSSGTFLYQSDIPHSTYIELRIKQSEAYENNHMSGIHPREEIVTVQLTAVQWADLLTNMNSMGVPCTVTRILGTKVEEYEPVEDRLKTAFRYGAEYLDNMSVKGQLTRVREYIEDSKLSKKAKAELEVMTRGLDTMLKSNAKFYAKVFAEEAEKIVVDSKAEVEANRTYIMSELGKIKLNELKQLSDGKEY